MCSFENVFFSFFLDNTFLYFFVLGGMLLTELLKNYVVNPPDLRNIINDVEVPYVLEKSMHTLVSYKEDHWLLTEFSLSSFMRKKSNEEKNQVANI
jgi:hypothetical protein